MKAIPTNHIQRQRILALYNFELSAPPKVVAKHSNRLVVAAAKAQIAGRRSTA